MDPLICHFSFTKPLTTWNAGSLNTRIHDTSRPLHCSANDYINQQSKQFGRSFAKIRNDNNNGRNGSGFKQFGKSRKKIKE